jgi:ParB/RepB/Spo0J family partition protein
MTRFSFLTLAVMMKPMDGPIADIELSKMGERYGAFRIVNPRADAAMAKSMKKYGQLSPVVCARTTDSYELVDGFKRLRACRHIGTETLKAKILDATERVLKATIIQLNRGRSISELEEAMVLSSLYREDGLSQTEIAVLLGRHKSWVSRRISLIERLSDEAREDIRLGLLPRQPEGRSGRDHQAPVVHQGGSKADRVSPLPPAMGLPLHTREPLGGSRTPRAKAGVRIPACILCSRLHDRCARDEDDRPGGSTKALRAYRFRRRRC